MPPKKNPLKLNKLQLRTLVLAQVLAKDETNTRKDDASGEVTLLKLPHAHGNHVHVGAFVVAAKEVSGFGNPAVWAALTRKGLARMETPDTPILTADGVRYDTGLGHLLTQSDH